jgi:hypothetical protein
MYNVMLLTSWHYNQYNKGYLYPMHSDTVDTDAVGCSALDSITAKALSAVLEAP